MQGRSVSAQIHHVSEGGTLEPRKRTRFDLAGSSDEPNAQLELGNLTGTNTSQRKSSKREQKEKKSKAPPISFQFIPCSPTGMIYFRIFSHS
jgi:hypothetical protein